METSMVRRKLLDAARVAVAFVPWVLLSCSNDGGSGGTANDGGTSDAVSDASTAADGTTDNLPDATPMLPDGAVAPSGTRLVPGSITLAGVTKDNYAVYVDDNSSTFQTLSLAGGAPTTIGSVDDRFAVRGSVVVTWAGSARVAQLSVWTAAHGQKILAMSSYASTAAVAVSPDGAQILYFDGVDAARTRGNLFIAKTDGTSQTVLATSVALSNTRCAPTLAFGGNAAAVAAFCITPSAPDAGDAEGSDTGTPDAPTSDAPTADADAPDAATDGGAFDGANPDAGSAPMAVVQSYTGATWAMTTIATKVQPRVAVAPTGTTVLVSAPEGLVAYPITGGAPTLIDTVGGAGTFTEDGLSVIYTTPDNALKRATLASPSPITLAPTGFSGLRAKSPDEKWLLGYTVIDTLDDVSDLYLASATARGTPTTLTAALTAGLFGSDGFTADSSHAIYYTGIDAAVGVGTLYATALPGGTPVTLAMNAWLHYAATGSKVVFDDNYDRATNTADIRVAHTAQTAPASLIVSLADADFFIAGTKDKVVYAWKYLSGPMSGLWVTPIP